MAVGRRWQLVGLGVFLLMMWAACWAVTVIPGPEADPIQWTVGNALAFLAGGAFGAAVLARRAG
jgi:hypothetical protein